MCVYADMMKSHYFSTHGTAFCFFSPAAAAAAEEDDDDDDADEDGF